jgi:hypothetical protein
MKRCGSILILIAIMVIIALLPSEKKQIKKAINISKQALINEDIDGLMDNISFNYYDDYGGSYLQFRKRAEHLFNSFDDFDIVLDIMRVDINEKEALVNLKASIIASADHERGYLLGDAGGSQNVKVYFEKSVNKWNVAKVEGITKEGQAAPSAMK